MAVGETSTDGFRLVAVRGGVRGKSVITLGDSPYLFMMLRGEGRCLSRCGTDRGGVLNVLTADHGLRKVGDVDGARV